MGREPMNAMKVEDLGKEKQANSPMPPPKKKEAKKSKAPASGESSESGHSSGWF